MDLQIGPVPPSAAAAVGLVQAALGNPPDLVIRPFHLLGAPAAVLYFEGLVDSRTVQDGMLGPLMAAAAQSPASLPGAHPAGGIATGDGAHAFDRAATALLPSGQLKVTDSLDQALDDLLDGHALLLVDGAGRAVTVQAPGWEKRQVSEPPSEPMVRGPREGFIESLTSNLALVRRRLPVPELRVWRTEVGRRTRTSVALLHLQGVADEALVGEARRRIERIQIDGVLDATYVDELIRDAPWSPFPTMRLTERPDVVVSQLLEGRVAILVDGSPEALTAPVVLWELFQPAEDHYENFIAASVLRWMRLTAAVTALVGGPLFVAMTSFHHEMIPTVLVLRLAATLRQTPLPAWLAVLLYELVFELLREASVRMPKQIGGAISIVGGIVLGEMAVRSGIVSPATVLVISATGISGFALPPFAAGVALRLLRFPMLLLSAGFGFVGVVAGVLALLIHLCGLRSLGRPYLAPLAPAQPLGLLDTLVRARRGALRWRPQFSGPRDRRRQAGP